MSRMSVKYVLVGEMHGTNEASKAFLDIIENYGAKNVALEWPSDFQKNIDEFMEGRLGIDKLPVFNTNWSRGDGRASEAMKRLLVELKRRKLKVYAIEDYSLSKDKDIAMAKSLKKISGRVVALMGNVHALKTEYNGIKTCGSLLPSRQTVSFSVESVNGGKVCNVIEQKPEIRNVFDPKLNKSYSKFKLPVMVPSEEEGYSCLYLVNKFTPSRTKKTEM